MAEESVVNTQFRRNNYFFGKLLTVNDFQLEQQYFKGKHELANRLFHGSGIVEGLVVEELQQIDDEWKIKLTEGIAIDTLGNDIIVPFTDYYRIENTDKILELKSTSERLGIFIGYEERSEINVTDVTGENKCEKNIIEEDFRIFVDVIAHPSDSGVSSDEANSNAELVSDSSQTEPIGNSHESHGNIFLAAIRFDAFDGKIKIDESETKKYRKLVVSLPSLFDLFSSHIYNKENPHDIDAKKLGVLKSINGIPEKNSDYESNLELISNSLEFYDHTDDSTLKKNQLKIDFKEEHYHTLTGLVRINYTGPEKQEFGPIQFKNKRFVFPPAVFVGKSEFNPKSGNFDKISYMDNDPDMGLEFEVKNISLNDFHITLKNNLKKKTLEPVYLRYWVVPHYGTEQDLVSFTSTIKQQLDVNLITEFDHKMNISLDLERDEPVDLILKTLGGQYKKFEFHKYSSVNPVFEIPISSISDIPGDIVDISLLNDPEISTLSKLSPKIKTDKDEYFIDDDLTITIQDYEQKDNSMIHFAMSINDIALDLQAIKSDTDGEFVYCGNLSKIFDKLDASQKLSLTIRYDYEFRNQKHQCTESIPAYCPEIFFDLPENFNWHEHLIKISVRNYYLSNLNTIPITVYGVKTDGTELPLQEFKINQVADGMFSDAYDLSWWLQVSDLTQLEQIAYLKCSYEFEDQSHKKRQITQQQLIQN